MKINFKIKIDESLGIIYEKPIFGVHGSFEEEELEEFLTTISKDMREYLEKHIKEAKE